MALKKTRVVLVFPRFKYPTGDIPYGIMLLASYLRKKVKNIDVSVLDTTFNPSLDYVRGFLKKKKPDIVGIYGHTIAFYEVLKVAKIAKQLGAYTIVGGPHACILPQTLIKQKQVDAVCIGEGELTLEEVVKRIQAKKGLKGVKGLWHKKKGELIKEPRREGINNLDALPFPAWDLVDMKRYIKYWFQLDSISPNLTGVNIIASRGCPFQCTFCQPSVDKIFGKGIRVRSPENVIKEIKALKKRYKINAFVFIDETLPAYKTWMRKFCALMKKENLGILWGCNTRVDAADYSTLKMMRQAGLRKIYIGLESGSQKILDQIYNKRIKVEDGKKLIGYAKKLGIKTQAYFMIGAPTETREEIMKTIKYARSLDLDVATFSITNPLPGTYLFESIKAKYPVSSNFRDFDFYYTRSYKDGVLSAKQVRRLHRLAFFYFYLHPKRIPFLIQSLRRPDKALMKLKRIMS